MYLMRRVHFGLFAIMLCLASILAGCWQSGAPAPAAPQPSGEAAPGAPAETPTASAPAEAASAVGQSETPEDGDWLIGRLNAEMSNLNPYTSTDAYSSEIKSEIFEGLLRRDPQTLEMKAHIAESWSVSDDHLAYTFKLRQGVTFSDGTPVTAEDVKFSYDTIMAPTTDAPHLRNYYQDVTACDILDPNTIRFTCSKPYFLHINVLGGLEILPKHVYGQGDFNTHPNNNKPVGSGPYMLEKWESGQQIVLIRNDNYWGKVVGRMPHFTRKVFKIITDEQAALQVMMRGDLDVMTLRAEDWMNRGSQPKFVEQFNKYEFYSPQYNYTGWNGARAPFDDKRVRRAMTMLLDRDTIRDTLYFGLANVVVTCFMPGTPEDNEAIKAVPYDPEQAKKLLDEVGWIDHDGDGIRDKDGKPFKFEMLIANASRTAEMISTSFLEDLKRVGISMEIRSLEWATMLQSVDQRQFDAVMMAWSMTPDPDPYQVWHSSQSEKGSNYVWFRNQEADQLIEQARVSFSREDRCRMYHRFAEILADEQPYTFMFCPKTLLAISKRIKGVKMYPFGPDATDWYVPTAEQKYGKN